MIDLNIITTLVSPMIVIGCWVLGYVLKNAVPSEKINPFIPLILAIVGIVCNVWSIGFFTYETVITGAVSGLAATGMYEGIKNILHLSSEKEEEQKEEEEQAKHFKEK